MLANLQRDLNTHGLRRQTSTGGEDLLDCGCKPCYLNMVCGGRPHDVRAFVDDHAAGAGADADADADADAEADAEAGETLGVVLAAVGLHLL